MRATALALVLASLGGCMLDPLYAVYAVAGVGDEDSSVANNNAYSAASGQGWRVIDVVMGHDDASLRRMIIGETAERYRPLDCRVIQFHHLSVAESLASAKPLVRQYGQAEDAAIRQVWREKGCSPAYAPLGRIGATIYSIDPTQAPVFGLPASGVVIEQIVTGSPAMQAGLLARDVVVAWNERQVANVDDYLSKSLATPSGTPVTLKVWRSSRFIDISVVVGSAVPSSSLLPVSANPVVETATSQAGMTLQGMTLGAVTASYAQAAGLPQARGAWVIDTSKGSAAEVAGVRPLDVIVEVAGQEIDSVNDLLAISAKMRAGYKTTVTVMRKQARLDLQMVLKK